MSGNEQRRANGERSKAQFTAKITEELDRLEAEINRQAKLLVPERIVITQESVAKAVGFHRTTFKGHYHKPLRERLARLSKRFKDPKSTRTHDDAKLKAPVKSTEESRPRIGALQEANNRLANENRLLRRELYRQRITA